MPTIEQILTLVKDGVFPKQHIIFLTEKLKIEVEDFC